MRVDFYPKEEIEDSLLQFAVIAARYQNKWVFCKHKNRTTLELPGGHREENERIGHAARRELYEETGAVVYQMEEVCVYSVSSEEGMDGRTTESFGMLYLAEIEAFEPELHHEIEQIFLLEELPEHYTYPLIQPKLIAEILSRGLVK